MFCIKFCNDALKFITNSRNKENKFNIKILKVIKSTSIPKFSHYLLSIDFMIKLEYLILIFYILVPNTTIKAAMKTL